MKKNLWKRYPYVCFKGFGRSYTRRYERDWLLRSKGRIIMVDLSKFPSVPSTERLIQEMLMYGVIDYSIDCADTPSITYLDIGQVHRNRVREDREFFAKKKNKVVWVPITKISGFNRPGGFIGSVFPRNV